MPIVIAQLIRTVIMALITAAPITVLQEMVDGTFKKIVDEIRSAEGLSLDEAKDILVNVLIDLSLNAAVVGTVVKTKIAVKTAEYLGFSSKGFIKRVLTPKAATVAANLTKDTAKIKGKDLFAKVLKVVAIPGSLIWLASAIANIIEPGIYKPEQTNAVYKKLGIPFQFPTTPGQLQPGPFDIQQFKDYASALEKAGVKGFNNTYTRKSEIYSRQGLADLINVIYGEQVLKGNALTAKQMIPLLAPFLIGGDATVASPSSTLAKPTSSAPVASEVKVFTGIVSQGTVGGDLIFTPRPDDLIENATELQQAINNNIAPYLASLLNQVTYEIKVVSSVIVNGIRQTGTTQRIQSGTNKNGTPKYKLVTNKFAVADLYLIRDGGTRSKLTSIVLGPVNAISFQPTQADLIKVASNVSKNVLTSNTNEINTIVSNTPTTTIPPASPAAPISTPSIGYTFIYDGVAGSVSWNTATVDRLRNEIASGQKTLDEALAELKERHTVDYGSGRFGEDYWANQNQSIVPYVFQYHIDLVKKMLTTGGTFQAGAKQYGNLADESPPNNGNASTESPAPTIGSVANALPPAALSANTLFGFYQALNKPLPSVAERAALYQSLGLGQAAFYTGTGEQNTKLLYKLQNDPL